MNRGPILTTNPVNLDHPLCRGLVGWWMPIPGFSRGSKLVDLLGRNHGTLTNMDPATDWVTDSPVGGWGSVGPLSGGGDKGVVLDASVGPYFSFGMWFNVPSFLLNSDRAALLTNNAGVGNASLSLHFTTGNVLRFMGDNAPGIKRYATGTTTLQPNTWYFAVGTIGPGDSISVYLNGELEGTGTLYRTTGVTTTTNRLFGPTAGAIGYQPGVCASAMFVNTPLSTSQVAALYDESRRGYPNMLRRLPTIKYFVQPASVAANGSGSVSAVGSLTGAGQTSRTGEGDVTAIGSLTGVGSAANGGSGSIAAVASLTGAGQHLANGQGVVDAIGALTGAGSAAMSGAGSVTAIASLTGAGTAPVVGGATGAGTITAIATLVGSGSTTNSGAGSVDAIGSLTGAGTAPTLAPATGAGSVTAIGSLTGAGQTTRTGEGDVTAIGSLTGAATAPNGGSGSIAAVASLTGAGQQNVKPLLIYYYDAFLATST